MKHGNKDALSSFPRFLSPLSSVHVTCRAVARSFNRPRLLAPRVVGVARRLLRPSHRRSHHSNLLPVYVIFACLLFAGLLHCSPVAIMSRFRESRTSPLGLSLS